MKKKTHRQGINSLRKQKQNEERTLRWRTPPHPLPLSVQTNVAFGNKKATCFGKKNISHHQA